MQLARELAAIAERFSSTPRHPDEASSLPKLCKALHKWQLTVKKASAKFNKYSDDEDSESDESD